MSWCQEGWPITEESFNQDKSTFSLPTLYLQHVFQKVGVFLWALLRRWMEPSDGAVAAGSAWKSLDPPVCPEQFKSLKNKHLQLWEHEAAWRWLYDHSHTFVLKISLKCEYRCFAMIYDPWSWSFDLSGGTGTAVNLQHNSWRRRRVRVLNWCRNAVGDLGERCINTGLQTCTERSSFVERSRSRSPILKAECSCCYKNGCFFCRKCYFIHRYHNSPNCWLSVLVQCPGFTFCETPPWTALVSLCWGQTSRVQTQEVSLCPMWFKPAQK